jgi:2-succinyl-5-enolpyruvyl-6-hydroxy-3-cyclohexene-1-carboxylate synthase
MSALRYNLDYFVACLKSMGLNRAVISPGSRNAPIVAGFLRIGDFELLSAPDERAAAFMALGSAQSSGKACAVVCTSGTAVLNLYPAVCEAYYQQIPLIAISADRPEEMIDRWDGQTIRQNGIFEKHILHSFHIGGNLHETTLLDEVKTTAHKAWNVAHGINPGPVHINIPLAEPIYADIDIPPQSSFPELPSPVEGVVHIDIEIPDELLKAEKILVLAGQSMPNTHLNKALNNLGTRLPVIADVLSNMHGPNTLSGTENKTLFQQASTPDVLITTGMSVVSKSLKEWIRVHKPKFHFHVSDKTLAGDPFFTNPRLLHCNPANFLNKLYSLLDAQKIEHYKKDWKPAEIKMDWETRLVFNILDKVEKDDVVHLANSMTVRQANLKTELSGHFYGNRGTSGIDGSVSTAVGFAWSAPQKRVICISGDIGFLYDKNAFWCRPFPKNLKVFVINNHGGEIFNRISGPGQYAGLLPFIQTPHGYSASEIAAHYRVDYRQHQNPSDDDIINFLKASETGIFEIITAT